MSFNESKSILVTGSPRSGTTWVGRVLGAATGTRYSREPFHFTTPHPGTHFRARSWFEYLPPTENVRIAQLEPLFKGRSRPFARLNRDARPLARIRWRYQEFLRGFGRPLNIVKDPLAVNSAETLAKAFDSRVVFMVRKPERIVKSYLTQGWDFDLAGFVATMRPLAIFDESTLDSIEDYRSMDTVHRVSHMWRLLSIRARGMRERQPEWFFCRHEDFVEEPNAEFMRLCEGVGVEFGGGVKQFLVATNQKPKRESSAVNPLLVNRSINALRQDGACLPPESQRIVSEICGEERRHWYPESE